MLRVLFILLLFITGSALVVRTALDWAQQKSYAFKNTALRRRQSLSVLTGGIGGLILFALLLYWLF